MSRQGEIASESEEVAVIPITVANALTSADRENGVGDASIQAGSFPFGELKNAGY